MNPTYQQKIIEIEATGMSLTDIANGIGLSVQGASDIKQGRTKQPRANAAIALNELHRKCIRKSTAAKIRANRSR